MAKARRVAVHFGYDGTDFPFRSPRSLQVNQLVSAKMGLARVGPGECPQALVGKGSNPLKQSLPMLIGRNLVELSQLLPLCPYKIVDEQWIKQTCDKGIGLKVVDRRV